MRGVAALLVVGIGAFFAVGADRPRRAYIVPAEARAGLAGHSRATSRVPGLGQVGFRIVDARGSAGPRRCALLADKQASQARGMMGRRDLAGYDAMVFRWYVDTDQGFWNKGVPIPLSIAWFDAAGVFVAAADMPVCSATCPATAPPVDYRVALEVPKGGLSHLGIGPGSAIQLGGGC